MKKEIIKELISLLEEFGKSRKWWDAGDYSLGNFLEWLKSQEKSN